MISVCGLPKYTEKTIKTYNMNISSTKTWILALATALSTTAMAANDDEASRQAGETASTTESVNK